MSIQEWIEQIIGVHHAYLRRELPSLSILFRSLEGKSNDREGWEELYHLFMELRFELERHILKEEGMLFPSILHIEKSVKEGTSPDLSRYDLREPMDQAEYEHGTTEDYLSRMTQLMERLSLKRDFPELFRRLEELKKDLEEHIRKEEEGLFPEAKFLYAKATEGMLREE